MCRPKGRATSARAILVARAAWHEVTAQSRATLGLLAIRAGSKGVIRPELSRDLCIFAISPTIVVDCREMGASSCKTCFSADILSLFLCFHAYSRIIFIFKF